MANLSLIISLGYVGVGLPPISETVAQMGLDYQTN